MVLVCQIMDDSPNLLNILVYHTYVLELKSATARYVKLTYVPIQMMALLQYRVIQTLLYLAVKITHRRYIVYKMCIHVLYILIRTCTYLYVRTYMYVCIGGKLLKEEFFVCFVNDLQNIN